MIVAVLELLLLGARQCAADLDVDIVQQQRVGWFARVGRLGALPWSAVLLCGWPAI